MAYFQTSLVEDNEVVKADDINFGFKSQIDNVGKALQMILEADTDFVIGGKVSPYNGMNVQIAPIFGACYSNGEYFGSTETIKPVAITPSSTSDRIDILEIEYATDDYDEQQRAFNDLETGVISYKNVKTKTRRILNIVAKMGEPSSTPIAPSVTEGRVKLAEIYIPANASTIRTSNIYNITSDVSGEANEDWTADKDATYNIGYISEVNERFRQEHNKDGTHKTDSIGNDALNTGTASDQVNAANIPITSNMTVGDVEKSAGSSINETLNAIATKITSLFTSYLKNGAFNFNGTVSISDLVSEDNILTNALKIKNNGAGIVTLSIGDVDYLQINCTSSNKSISVLSDYTISINDTESDTTKLVNAAVTNSLWVYVKALRTDVNYILNNLDPTSSSNLVLSKFNVATDTIVCATISNIELSGLQTIDGVSVSAGQLVLVKNQDDEVENGIYEVSSSTWTRGQFTAAEDGENIIGMAKKFFTIVNGTENKGKMFYTNTDSFTVDVSSITWLEFIGSVSSIANKLVMRDANNGINVSTINGKSIESTASNTSTNIPTTGMAISCGNAGAICSTAKSTSAKVVTLNGFALYSGVTVKVMFTNGNSGSSPTLNVNGTGAKSIKVVRGGSKIVPTNHTGYWRGASSTSSEMWQAYTTLEFIYDGTDWVIIGNPTVESYVSSDGTSSYEVKADGLVTQDFYYNSGSSGNGKGTTFTIPIIFSKIISAVTSPFDINISTSSSCRIIIGVDSMPQPTKMKVWCYYDKCWGMTATLKGY